jgi:hypothetical protein
MGAPEDPSIIVIDAGSLPADAAAVDALARMQLIACRFGHRVFLRNVAPDLRDLLAFAGLDALLGVEPRRQAEELEEPLGLEEERQLPDAPL